MSAVEGPTQKVAVVTGAGSGIGRASSLALGRNGFVVVLAGRQEGALAETARLGKEQGSSMHPVVTDVREPQSVQSLFRFVKESCGRVDVLFNNAGRSATPAPIPDIPYDQWFDTLQVNLTGFFLCTQEAFRLMREQAPQGGRIINNGSISAHTPRPGSAPYTATKHGISGLTKTTALDGRPWNIACSQIDIGNALTKRTQGFVQGTLQANGTVLSEPTMDTEQVANAVAYMAGLPLDTNILFMTIMATNMPFVGRG